MKYRELGNTGVMVSEIGMGCEGFGEDNCSMTKELFDLAEERGVNYFDLYTSNPAIRRAVGEAMKGRREKFIVQSHICSVWQDGQYKRTRKISEVKAGFAEMLELLLTDYIDVGMIHYCDALSDWDEIVNGGVLDYAHELKKEGKIRHIGLSSHNPQVALKAVESGAIEVLMFSVNPCYDLQPANEDVEELWAAKNYSGTLTNMDPDRQRLYETCQRLGVGITVMKCFGGGDLLDAKLSPAGAALTVNQCIHYALTRPAVSSILCGYDTTAQIDQAVAYENASADEKDYASVLANAPYHSYKGQCTYCGHCKPCPSNIDIAMVNKFYDLAKQQPTVPQSIQSHYELIPHKAAECIACQSCESRCPFEVKIAERMKKAAELFGC